MLQYNIYQDLNVDIKISNIDFDNISKYSNNPI